MASFFKNIYSNKRKIIIFIFLASLFFNFSFLAFFKNIGPAQHRKPGTDYIRIFEPVAENILNGKGFVLIDKDGTPRSPAPFGYPLILSGIFTISNITGINRLELIVFFNVLFSSFASILLFLIVDMLFNKRIALISSLAWASYPFNLWLIKNPNPECPFILLFLFALWLLILSLRQKRVKLIFLVGIFFALVSLTRIIVLLLPFFIVFFFLLFFPKNERKNVLLFIAVFLIGYIFVLLPWNLYLSSKTGNFIPVSKFVGYGFKDGFNFALKTGMAGDKVIIPEGALKLIKRIRSSESYGIIDQTIFFLKETKRDPISSMELILIKLERAWYATDQMWWEKQILMVQILYLSVSIFGLIYVFKKDKEWKQKLLLMGIILYFWIITSAGVTLFRYMIPAMALVLVFFAVSVDFLINKLMKQQHFHNE